MTIASSPKKLKLEPTFTPLPDHLIEENILIRLEVKPLIRLAGVSKGWSSMISSTKFTKEHLKQWYPSNDRSLIVQDDRDTEGEDKYYLSFDENYNLNEFVELRNKYPTYLFKPLKSCVVGSCNGLLCMLNEETMRIYVWNPMTNVVRDTMGPAPHFCRSEDYEVRCVGFGYVSSIDEYKIGCLMFYKKTLLSLVFSLKTGRWAKRRQRKKHYKKVLACIDRETPVFVNDTIYWISDIIEDGHSFLIGLDLVYDDMIFLKTFVNIPQGFATAKLCYLVIEIIFFFG
ncbi:putative F-box protein At1g33530 [Chenopodium quinoa]|uniref:F-box associated beta-propeller type 1 domain-containing protein n=1 Tax=Chenopodium quinoa TaxID=63459 RepID=A0A803LMX8_CHEQI|nr:putative F-box protein At1g33530 [Chenopodium quinoa]